MRDNMRQPPNHNGPLRRKPERQAGSGARPDGAVRSRRNGEQTAVRAPTSEARAIGEQRIAKVIARAGLCSRRDAEAWIEQGRVSVNGTVLTSPALNVGTGDEILVDGVPLAARERTRLFLFHKPRGYVTTSKDPLNRPTVFDILPKDLPRLISIGRLDINTQGLLLLTNDGGLARVLELPRTGWLRRYRVRANGTTDQAALDKLAAGITLDGMNYGPIEAKLDRVQGANVWLTLGLREGKNREVKRVLESLNLIVNRLIRISFGPFQLLDLADGAVAEVNGRVLREQLGEAISLAAQADFESPKAPVAPARISRPLANPATAVEPEAPRRERPEKGKRKHISVLRAERRASALQPRKIERGATADRNGREVKVERLVAVGPPKRGSKPRSPHSRKGSAASGSARQETSPNRKGRQQQWTPRTPRQARTADLKERVHSKGQPAPNPEAAPNAYRAKTENRTGRPDTRTGQQRAAGPAAAGRSATQAPRKGKQEARSHEPSKGHGSARPLRRKSRQKSRPPRPFSSNRPDRTPP
jgi:23S rRNA pseudouridine2605 synthase